jgi:hypothetical protein
VRRPIRVCGQPYSAPSLLGFGKKASFPCVAAEGFPQAFGGDTESGAMASDTIDVAEVAGALLVEARSLAAATDYPEWPAQARASSSHDLLAMVWSSYGERGPRTREGLALARQALSAADGGEAVESGADLVAVFDRAVSLVVAR